MSLTGLHRGEVAALRWTDIDLDDATLTVREQIVVVDGRDIVGPPKSASSCRTIALDATTVELMGKLRRRRLQLKQDVHTSPTPPATASTTRRTTRQPAAR